MARRRHRSRHSRRRSSRELQRRMRHNARRFSPPGLAGRIILMVVGIILLVQIVSWIFWDESRWYDKADELAAGQLIAATQLIEQTPVSERQAIANALTGITLSVDLADTPKDVNHHGWDFTDDIADDVEDLLDPLDGRDIRVGAHRDWNDITWLYVSVQLEDQSWVIYGYPLQAFAFDRDGSGIGPIIFWLFVGGVVYWLSNRLVRPIRTFSEAAERLGRDVNAPPLPVSGSREIRRAARAFNEMQTRIRRMIDDRTLMLAAIAHDLRTVLTRLRLRAEFIDDEEQQAKAAADIEEMQSMLDSSLAFARGETEAEERRTVNLAKMVQDLVDDISKTDGPATYLGPDQLIYSCGPNEMRRALSNVIRNAVVYGEEADVQLQQTQDNVRVTVSDKGPGIPSDLHEQVFQPFFRAEGSRNRETGGNGLGLAIARTIARRHGGDITLANRPTGGLTVTLLLPRLPG